jgi:putative FmdB family regulatory protein
VPTYEYRCSAGHQYEKREGFDAPAKQKCEKCGKAASRVIFAPPIVFKGNGFYKTDSRGSDTSTKSDELSTSTATASSTGTPAAGDHGHSHGPGGHTHGSDAASDTVESAAAS